MQWFVVTPYSLFDTHVESAGEDDIGWQDTLLHLIHDPQIAKTVSECISTTIWESDPTRAVESLADVITISMKKAERGFGEGLVEMVGLEEVIYMGEFAGFFASLSVVGLFLFLVLIFFGQAWVDFVWLLTRDVHSSTFRSMAAQQQRTLDSNPSRRRCNQG